MPIRVVDVEPMTSDDLTYWRANVPEGRTRSVGPAFSSWGGRGDPDQTAPTADRYEEGVAVVDLPALPAKRPEGRELTEVVAARFLDWARDGKRDWFLGRAKMLKATSPLQFSHLSDAQLAAQLHAVVLEKARVAVERNAARHGWYRRADLDLQTSGVAAQPIYLPGQKAG